MKILNSSPDNFTIEFNTFDSNGLPMVQHITNNNDQILLNTHNTEPLQQLLSVALEPIKEGKTTEIEGFNTVFFYLVRHCKRIFAMLSNDINHIARKMGEEAIETIVAAIGQTKKDTISESADLIYHWLLLLKKLDIEPEEVYKELKDRMSS